MKKCSFSKRKGVSRSKNSKKHRRVSRKTFRNKMMKGGFNQTQFTAAFAVAAAMHMDKVVLIPNEKGIKARSKRYDFVIDKDNIPTLTNYKKNLIVPNTRSKITVNNFDIYVGSTTDNLLIKMEGIGGTVTERLAKLTTTLITPNNSEALIKMAENNELITKETADDLKYDVNNTNILRLTNGQGNVNPEDDMFIKVVQLIISLVKLFFNCLEYVLNPPNSRISGNEIPTFRNEIPQSSEIVIYDKPSELSTAIVEFVTTEDHQNDTESAKAIYESTLGSIDELPQYIDNGDSYPTIEDPDDNQYRCVTPYDSSETNMKARIRSCNKVGRPARGFEDKRYTHNGLCYPECIKK